MAEFPALPLWTDAYLADTAHLSYEDHGLYLHMLMTMWRTPGCQIPNDDTWINKRFRGHANALRTLCEEFCTLTDDGKFWFQKKLRKQFEWCREKSKKNSESANYRWNNNKASCDGNANAIQTQSERYAPKPKSKSIPTLKNGYGDLKEELFKALPATPEFIAWEAHAFAKEISLWRELQKRKMEGRGFEFPSRFPPDHKGAP
jgi:uncharacterized protein YdaU (DUF1376 family)